MKQRALGRGGPRVSAIGLGRGATPIRFGDPLEADFTAAVHRALDLGIDFLDTSDAYWDTRHEVLLGRALAGRRDRAFVATKFGNITLPDGRKAMNGRPEYVVQCCEASLARLGIGVIDLFYLHRVDPAVPIEETLGAMAGLVKAGKVRWLGICEASPETLERAHRTHPIAALQTEYSLWAREAAEEMLPVCRRLGIGFVGYAPLGRGLLTGRIKSVEDLPETDRRRRHPRFVDENIARNVALVRELEAMAAAKGCTPAQLALAWLLAQGEDVIPIPGTSHARNVELNAAAADIALTAGELEQLGSVFAPGAGAGTRYPAHVMKGLGL